MSLTTTPVISSTSVLRLTAKTAASLLLAALVAGPLMAQTPAQGLPAANTAQTGQSSQTGKVEGAEVLPEGEPEAARSAVRSYQQDAGSRIEELRVRGQTREITVTPSGTMPSYEVVPGNSHSNSITTNRSSDGTNGPRRWKIGEF